MLQQTYTPSNTGIESFIRASADYDLAPVGIGSMQEQAERLAEFGRNGDIYVVHAAEGETVVPTEVLDANPQVKEMLFAQMRDMGLNPDEYVVGSELNSINPDTGMPEFFFKKLFRGVKKIIKKAAPLIVATLGNMVLPGIGGILASAIYTKATGGSWGDVLKGAAMSYLGGAVMGGFTAGPGVSFGEGFSQGLTSPFDALSDLSGSASQGIFGSSGAANAPGASWGDKIFPTYDPAAVSNATMTPAQAAAYNASGAVTTTQLPPEGFAAGPAGGGGWDPGVEFGVSGGPPMPNVGETGFSSADFVTTPNAYDLARAQNFPMDEAGNFYAPNGQKIPPNVTGNLQGVEPPVAVPSPTPTDIDWDAERLGPVQPGGPGKPTLYPKDTSADIDWSKKATEAKKWLTGGGESPEWWDAKGLAAGEKYLAETPKSMRNPMTYAAKVKAGADPGYWRTYGPTTAILGGAAYLGGAFDEPERDPGMSDEEWERKKKEWAKNKLFEENPQDYIISDLDPYKYPPTPNPYVNRVGLMERQPRYMTNGGAAQYPRREMLVEGPGTERSDDIPAMLSDGEFVLNSRSVRGADPAGQGNRYRGAQNLYNMMRNFEMRA
jgi:hypothetical protein